MIVWIGWLGVVFGLLVGPSQLIKLIKTHNTQGISKWTYVYLNMALICYLIYAISIKDSVFIVAQGVNLWVNSAVLILLLKYRRAER